MKLHLTSAYESHSGLDALLASVPLDRFGQHESCDSAEQADAILFVEDTQFDDPFFNRLLQHPLLERWPEKVFMYNEMDKPWDVLPGLYCCLPKRQLEPARHRAAAYLHSPNPFVGTLGETQQQTRYLFSFMGSMSHACRRPIMRLRHPDAFLQDTSDFNVWNSEPQEMQERGSAYARVLAESRFVLCPRGIGTSSIRLYETLEAGRVPVIIADDWAPPIETDWSFAIQVQERRVSSIPGLLAAMSNEAADRGLAARHAWLEHYAQEALFNTVGEALNALSGTDLEQRGRRTGGPWNKWLAGGNLLTRTAAQRWRDHH